MNNVIDNDKSRDSRRKFIKGAAAAVYVAPLVVSMEAKASFLSNGSNETPKGCRKINGYLACQ